MSHFHANVWCICEPIFMNWFIHGLFFCQTVHNHGLIYEPIFCSPFVQETKFYEPIHEPIHMKAFAQGAVKQVPEEWVIHEHEQPHHCPVNGVLQKGPRVCAWGGVLLIERCFMCQTGSTTRFVMARQQAKLKRLCDQWHFKRVSPCGVHIWVTSPPMKNAKNKGSQHNRMERASKNIQKQDMQHLGEDMHCETQGLSRRHMGSRRMCGIKCPSWQQGPPQSHMR